MIRLIFLSLMLLCVMPSSSVATPKHHTMEQSLDAHARYRNTRHYQGRRSSYRHYNRTRVYVSPPVKPTTPTPAKETVEFLSKQDPIRWGDIDISRLHKPMDAWLEFPPDPGKFKLPADPPNLDSLLPKVQSDPKPLFYFFAIVIMGILGTGLASELNKVRTCHKRIPYSLADIEKQYKKLAPLIRRFEKKPASLT